MLEEFIKQIDEQIEKAIELGRKCGKNGLELNTSIETIDKLDEVVEFIRNLYQKGLIDENVAWNTALSLGTLLGEMIIKKHGFRWHINRDNIPIIKTPENDQLSPITKVYKIIVSEDDIEGRPSSFYNGFIALNNNK